MTALDTMAPSVGIAPTPAGVRYVPDWTAAGSRRWVALDVARGIAVAGMLVVEQMPGGPRPHPWLVHATWNGWTGADLVFPAFLFLVGISVDELVRRRGPKALLRLARRAFTLVVVGMLFNAWAGDGSNFSAARWPGVLQRIGLVSLLCGVVVVFCQRRIWPILLVAVAILALYAIVLTRVSLACGTDVITPTCNVPGSVDRALFGAAHIYQHGALGHDPEGLLSTMGAVATALFGVTVGRVMRTRPGWPTMAALCGAAFLAWMITHLGLAGPAVNKRLWTPAFVLLTAGTSTLLLVACHGVSDVGARIANPLVRRASQIISWPWSALGRNALVVYVGQHVLGAVLAHTRAHIGAQQTNAAGYVQAHSFGIGWLGLDSQWAYVIGMLLAWTAVAAAMHRARWYVTL